MEEILKNSMNKTQKRSAQDLRSILCKKERSFLQGQHIKLTDAWDLEAFGLQKVKAFNILSEDKKFQILNNMSLYRLQEAHSIETAGMTFTAKMSLLAISEDEQILYSHFAKDEAQHLAYFNEMLAGYYLNSNDDPFIRLLKNVIMSGSRRSLIFIIQILLEGWGIDHYHLMSFTCKHPLLKKILGKIIADEAAHHASGLILFDESELTKNEFKYICDIVAHFLELVTMGPISVLGQIESAHESLTSRQRNEVYKDLDALSDVKRKLNILKSLMIKAKSLKIVKYLEDRNLFAVSFSEVNLFVNPANQRPISLML